MAPAENQVAAFDFDGTLTTGDSFVRFLAWHRPPLKFAADLVLTSHLLVLYALRLVPNERHKMALFARRFRGVPAAEYTRLAREFSLTRVPALIRPEARARLRAHQARGDRVVIVTASLADWIAPWAETEGVTEVIGSRAAIRDGRLTGGLEGPNCHGPEKVRRLFHVLPARSSFRLVAYGDSHGDRELLAAADESHYRRFP